MAKSSKSKPRKTRHYFFLSPHEDAAFWRCPKCNGKTKLRKIPLVIHIDPKQLFTLNKKCQFCPHCELVIAKQAEVEDLMVGMFGKKKPEIIGNDYLVIGTLDKRDWRQTQSGKLSELSNAEFLDRVFIFVDHLNFAMIPGGWYKVGEHPSDKQKQ